MDVPTPFDHAPTLALRAIRSLRERIPAAQRTPLLILVSLLLLVLVGAALWPAIAYTRQPHPTFATARLGDVILSTQVNGRVEATTYEADFAVDGTLSEIDVTLDQQVSAGTTLAKLNVAPFQSALTAAQATATAAQQSLSAAQNAQSEAQNAVDSAWTTLSEQQSYAQTACAAQPSDPTACDAANATVNSAQAQVDSAQAQLALAQAHVVAAQKDTTKAQDQTTLAQAQLAATTLKAPHAGIITAINGSVGSRPGASNKSLGSFITLMDTSAPLVTAPVSYRDISAVHAGESATFRVAQASANDVFTGAVVGVSPLGQGTGDELSYPVTLRIDAASLGDAKPLPGMTAATRIITRARYHVVVIPNSAVSYAREAAPSSGKGLLTNSQISAARAEAHSLAEGLVASGFDVASDPLTLAYLVGFKDNHYFAIPVALGLSDGKQWEVVAGLSAGQQVVDGQESLFFG